MTYGMMQIPTCFSERNALINELFQGLDFIDIVPTYQVNNEGDIEEYWAKFVGNHMKALYYD